MQACAPERMESMLAEWVASDDPKISGRMQRNAELLRTHGQDAVLCLMGRGVGEEETSISGRLDERGGLRQVQGRVYGQGSQQGAGEGP